MKGCIRGFIRSIVVAGTVLLVSVTAEGGPSAVARSKAPPFTLPQTTSAAGAILIHTGGVDPIGPSRILLATGGAQAYVMPRDATIQSVHIYVVVNSLNAAVTLRFTVNEEDTDFTGTIPASTAAPGTLESIVKIVIPVPGSLDVAAGSVVSLVVDRPAAVTQGVLSFSVSYEVR
jgi:hypothetical protein